MTDIQEQKEKITISTEGAENVHAKFDHIQLLIFRDTKRNVNCTPRRRKYSDAVKEYATTINYYSSKAYENVRSILPLPNSSLIKNGHVL